MNKPGGLVQQKINKLAKLRAERGFTIAKLSRISGVSWPTISAIEHGQRKAQLATLGKIAHALDIEIEELLEFHDTGAAERGKIRYPKD